MLRGLPTIFFNKPTSSRCTDIITPCVHEAEELVLCIRLQSGIRKPPIYFRRIGSSDGLDDTGGQDFPVAFAKPLPYPPGELTVCHIPVFPVGRKRSMHA